MTRHPGRLRKATHEPDNEKNAVHFPFASQSGISDHLSRCPAKREHAKKPIKQVHATQSRSSFFSLFVIRTATFLHTRV